MADHYVLRVTAGADYDPSGHVEVPVNNPQSLHITSDRADVELNVRVRDYRGLPRGSPASSPYFETQDHDYNQDQYSICFRFTPKAPATETETDAGRRGISGHDLQFGNDFARPIRDRLPPGFNTALRIVRWWIDPGLEGDAYADEPYLYGPALSSVNKLHVGPAEFDENKGGLWVEEGGAPEPRQEVGMPDDARARMKWALGDVAKDKWLFEYGTTYAIDFFNPYLDFSNLTLRLPGFQLPILSYWDSQGMRRESHTLRYVLRNKTTSEVYLVICFSIHVKEHVAEDGTILEDSEGRKIPDDNRRQDDSALEVTNPDDVD